jgi:hypothetical protein
LHSGGTWPLAIDSKKKMACPESGAFDISEPDVYSRYYKIGVHMEGAYLKK